MRAPRPISAARSVAPALGALLVAACGGEASNPEAPAVDPDVPVHTASPTFELGMVDGPEELEFGAIEGVLRLADGRIVIADGDDQRLHWFSATGDPLGATGGSGDGPGEFRDLRRLYPHGADSLLAVDARRGVSILDLDGTYAREIPAAEHWGGELWTMDAWPSGRFLIEGAADGAERARVDALAAGLPLPAGTSSMRFARNPGNGELWVRESRGGEGTAARWLVFDREGTPVRWIDLPPDFTPFRVDAQGEVVGRGLLDFGVNAARGYRLADSGVTRPLPGWIVHPVSIPDSARVDASELMETVRGSVRWYAMGQEMHYASNYRYSTDPDSLEIEPESIPEGLEVEILHATDRGWSMVAAHPDAPELCTLSYGGGGPAGWMGGRVSCPGTN